MPHAFDHNAFDFNAFDVDVVDATATITGVTIQIAVGNLTATGEASKGGSAGKKRRGPGRIVYPQLPRIYAQTAVDARVLIRGVAIKIAVGRLSATGAATATPNGTGINITAGTLQARGIQNPTDEFILELLDAA
jgi:hypothetical protein